MNDTETEHWRNYYQRQCMTLMIRCKTHVLSAWTLTRKAETLRIEQDNYPYAFYGSNPDFSRFIAKCNRSAEGHAIEARNALNKLKRFKEIYGHLTPRI